MATPSSSSNTQVTVHDPYSIPCTTTSCIPVHCHQPHQDPQQPQPPQQTDNSTRPTALSSRRKRCKRGSNPSHPAVQTVDVEEGPGSDVEDVMGPAWRCPYFQCPAGSLTAPGWLSKQSLMVHINNVHLAAGQSPPEEFLRLHHRSVCSHCKVLISIRGCPVCKGRISHRLLNPPPASMSGICMQSEQHHLQRDPFPLSCEWAFSVQCGTARHIPRAVRTEFAESLAECIWEFVHNPSLDPFHRLMCFPNSF